MKGFVGSVVTGIVIVLIIVCGFACTERVPAGYVGVHGKTQRVSADRVPARLRRLRRGRPVDGKGTQKALFGHPVR